jgi:hypothetical protein
MSKSATAVAKKLIEGQPGGLEDLHIHKFTSDASAHDDQFTERLYVDFAAEFERVQKELTKQYGLPSRTGETDDEVIPLNGVFRFSVWDVGGRQLFAAASHEDRGLPVLLMLGTT